MPSISQRVVDNLFSVLSTVPPRLLKVGSSRQSTTCRQGAHIDISMTALLTCATLPRSKKGKPEPEPKHSPTLPSEVLQLIFLQAVHPCGSDIGFPEKARVRSTILACTQVCQLWRYAARGYSLLWVHSVDFQHHPPAVVEDLLQLSRPHGIDVGHRSAPFRVTQPRDFVVLDLLEGERCRIQEWNVEVPESHFALNSCRSIFGVPDPSAPLRAHTLRLKGSVVSPSDPSQLIPPSVQKMCLVETNLLLSPWMNLYNLTELSVSGISPSSVKYELADWLFLLRGMPRLQFLALKDAIDPGRGPYPHAASRSFEPVVLSQLRLLTAAESNWLSASQLLRLLVSPSFQKPVGCGLNLTLPSSVTFRDNTFAFHNAVGLLRSVSIANLVPHPASFVSPRLEMELKAHPSGFRFTLGTVPDHEKNLDWNGDRGSEGVHDYLDDYFRTPIVAASATSLHPPLCVTTHNPTPQDIINTCVVNNHLFSSAKSLRITIEPRLCQSKELSPVLEAISGTLGLMRGVETLTLDEGAVVTVLPMLQGGLHISGGVPVPTFPNLQYLGVETAVSKDGKAELYHDQSGAAARTIMSQYTAWRMSVGPPVYAFAATGDEGRQRNGRWKRRGMVAIPL